MPTKSENESLDGMRRWTMRMNNTWSEAWEATVREYFSSDGKSLFTDPKRGRMIRLMMEGSHDSPAHYAKIRSPTLSFAVVGFPSKMLDCVKALPGPTRKETEEWLSWVKQFQEQEIEHFRKEIPNGRVVVFTNADHHCFIDRENEVVREMREFLAH